MTMTADPQPLDFPPEALFASSPLAPNMEQPPSWPSSSFYHYYPGDPSRSSSDRSTVLPPPHTLPAGQAPPEDDGPRRYAHSHSHSHGSNYPPPPPHSNSSHGGGGPPSNGSSMNLPPFSQTFYSSYHSPQSQHSAPGSAPQGLHPLPAHGMGGYPGHVVGQHGYYPMTSPGGVPGGLPGSGGRQPPPHSYSESPRMPAGYSSSPGMRNMSPISPTTHLAPPGLASGGSNSSSSYPSATRPNAGLPNGKRRSVSGNQSVGSWDEDDKNMPLDDEEQPWGMPQDQYKALNPRDKKQVRNRIGARRFRAKRKDYVSSIEKTLEERDDECAALRAQVDAFRTEINDLRHRLGIPLMPQPDPTALGLVVNTEPWDGEKERKE